VLPGEEAWEDVAAAAASPSRILEEEWATNHARESGNSGGTSLKASVGESDAGRDPPPSPLSAVPSSLVVVVVSDAVSVAPLASTSERRRSTRRRTSRRTSRRWCGGFHDADDAAAVTISTAIEADVFFVSFDVAVSAVDATKCSISTDRLRRRRGTN
jgi:hypothetical protein